MGRAGFAHIGEARANLCMSEGPKLPVFVCHVFQQERKLPLYVRNTSDTLKSFKGGEDGSILSIPSVESCAHGLRYALVASKRRL